MNTSKNQNQKNSPKKRTLTKPWYLSVQLSELDSQLCRTLLDITSMNPNYSKLPIKAIQEALVEVSVMDGLRER